MRMTFVLGTRPEIIKLAPVIREGRARGHDVELVHTAQHYDFNMSEQFFAELDLRPPERFLEVGSGSQASQLAKGVEACGPVLESQRPDCVCVVGDTNAGLTGALAGAKLLIPIVHFEAGVRSHDWRMPEEVNRRAIDSISSVCFGPTLRACQTLLAEGHGRRTWYVGDTLVESVVRLLPPPDGAPRAPYVLATIHRAENTDDPARLRSIMSGLGDSPIRVVFPVHPRTRSRLAALGISSGGSLELSEPVGYRAMLGLIAGARAVVTDSGGVQQEAAILGSPCVTVRDNTEWVETLTVGANSLVRPADVRAELEGIIAGRRASKWKSPFSPGASARSTDILQDLHSSSSLGPCASDFIANGIPDPMSIGPSESEWARRTQGATSDA